MEKNIEERKQYLELCKLYGYEVDEDIESPIIVTNEGEFEFDYDCLKALFADMVYEDVMYSQDFENPQPFEINGIISRGKIFKCMENVA